MNHANNDVEAAPPSIVFLSKAQVLQRIPVTGPTLWSWVRQGRFPKPRHLASNKTVWVEAEITAWMRERPERRYKP